MDACVGGWDAGMSRGGKLGQRIPVFNWEWGQRGIREHIRFSATELGMILGALDLRSSRRGVGGPLAYCCPGRSDFWVRNSSN